VASDRQSVTFVNESHDYPATHPPLARGKELVAEIVLKGGSKAVPWCYKPADD
jgi:hypothetical protein